MSILRLSGWQAGGFSDKSVFFGFCSGGSGFISQYWGVRDLAGTTKNVRARGCQHARIGAHLHAGSDACARGDDPALYREAAVVEAGVRYLRTAAPGALATAYVTVTAATLRKLHGARLAALCDQRVCGAAQYAAQLVSHIRTHGLSGAGVTGAALATVIAVCTRRC